MTLAVRTGYKSARFRWVQERGTGGAHACNHSAEAEQDPELQASLCYLNYVKTEINNHLLIPVFFGNFIQTGKHDGQDLIDVLLNQTENVFVIPEVQCSLCNLKRHEKPQNPQGKGCHKVRLSQTGAVGTWKWELETHLDICLKSGSSIFLNCVGSMTSKISSISPKNIT